VYTRACVLTLRLASACLQVNFFAQWEINNAVAPIMMQQRSGVIVNIGSATSYCAVAQAAAYSASK
jgi:short-subunit dehydrogenase